MASKKDIVSFLLNIPPDKLSFYCSTSERIVEICTADDFVREYSKKHGIAIKKRKEIKLASETFLPRFPVLPEEKAPDGYRVSRKWHWQYEVWASHLHYRHHAQGEIPHFNITPIGGEEIFHVYLGQHGRNFIIVDEKGDVIFVYPY